MGVVVDLKEGKRRKAAEKSMEEKVEEGEEVVSLAYFEEGCMKEEAQELEGDKEMEEEAEEPATFEPRKSNRVVDRKAKGKAVVAYFQELEEANRG